MQNVGHKEAIFNHNHSDLLTVCFLLTHQTTGLIV